MQPVVWILLAAALAFGVLRLLRVRARKDAERRSRTEKREKIARDDAKAIQRTLDGRR
jgi:hypothetical protein